MKVDNKWVNTGIAAFFGLLTLGVAAVAGWFVGWLIGASREPVVAGVISLIPTSLIAVALAYLDRRAVTKDLRTSLKGATEDKTVEDRIDRAFTEHQGASVGKILVLLLS